ncbi:MAG: GNAT family N-acetyltransferase [Symploca sp. SIO3C6]|uniref:GNAT family N-acetyltransferase n=1 Tax=Symploca sp. SIO1C4 TaxID=2607765 RepID=A0A6B3NFR8_9CYAN|nr:GNAT family N-acetyltransferase [Symploca sp. SIO3C6]NER28461.1 GNAT family N-acetyltransferase [Symploca sp. SIO1C4]
MPDLETARLKLRKFTLDDADDLYRIYDNPEVMKYVGNGARTRKETEAGLLSMIQHWQQHDFGMWAVIHQQDHILIGRCGLCFLDKTTEVELGYLFDKFYWGRGLATEASLAALKYGFEVVKLKRIVAVAKPENLASRRVMEKVGMKYEKDAHYYDSDVVYYSITL